MTERTIVVMPAYNAANTVERIFRDLPEGCFDGVILVDDCSRDDTIAIASRLGCTVLRHDRNRGYGGNQKTCYDAALNSWSCSTPTTSTMRVSSRQR